MRIGELFEEIDHTNNESILLFLYRHAGLTRHLLYTEIVLSTNRSRVKPGMTWDIILLLSSEQGSTQMHFVAIRQRCIELSFPAGDDRCGNCISNDVGCGAAHVEDLIDSQQQQQSGNRDVEMSQHSCYS